MLLLLTGCTPENGITNRTDIVGKDDIPDIVVEPSSLAFGDLRYGETGTQTFVIRNEGTDHSALTVKEVYLARGEDFTLLDGPTEPFTLRFGEERAVTVSFTATAPETFTGAAMVTSDDDDTPAVEVPMDGSGVMPRLVVTPSIHDYGDVTVGCTRDMEFVLANAGNDDLTLSDILPDGEGYAVAERPVLPLTLAPGATANALLTFAPTEDGASTGALAVASDDPRGPEEAMVTGLGALPGPQHVRYTVPTVNKLDLMVFVDQSASMDDDQTMLANNANAFATALAAMGDDVQVTVITRDDGCATSGVMHPNAPDFSTAFQDAVLDAPANVWTEAGLYVSLLALREAAPYRCNEGFIRDDAMLHVIYISDEPDQSPVHWYDVVTEMRTRKGASYLVKLSAVAGPVPWGCYEEGVNSAQPGDGYYEAVTETGGAFIDLCSNWAPELNVIATYGIERTTYALVGTPDVATITVTVDGILRTTGWHYMADSNAVVFDTDVPYSGQTVDIVFDVPLSCP